MNSESEKCKCENPEVIQIGYLLPIFKCKKCGKLAYFEKTLAASEKVDKAIIETINVLRRDKGMNDFQEIPVSPIKHDESFLKFHQLHGNGIVPPKPAITGIKIEAEKKKKKPLPKASLLYILTGLGRYSWYRIPFVKGIICVSLPAYIASRLWLLFRFQKGSCSCDNANCRFIIFLGLTIGLCKRARAKRKEDERKR